MTVTNEMISAAHKVTMEHGDIVLSYRLLTKIYLSMDALANREKTSGSPSRCSTCGGALPTTNDQDRTGECVCGEPTTTGVIHRTDGPCHHPDDSYWQEEARRYAANADFWRGKHKHDTALLRQALEALEHHVEQTRPIHRTSETITALQERLGETK